MSRWLRNSRGFSAGAFAFALLLALQFIATSAIASHMQAINLGGGTGEAQLLCLSDHDTPAPAGLKHKPICDICAFAAQSGTAPLLQAVLLPGDALRPAEILLPQLPHYSSKRHEPRLTRGPPLNA